MSSARVSDAPTARHEGAPNVRYGVMLTMLPPFGTTAPLDT
jgi:hypothetical protein